MREREPEFHSDVEALRASYLSEYINRRLGFMSHARALFHEEHSP